MKIGVVLIFIRLDFIVFWWGIWLCGSVDILCSKWSWHWKW